MFEDVYVDSSRSSSKKKYKQLQRLISKYNEIKKFQELNQDQNLTIDQKKKINKSSNKKKTLKRIHNELNKKLKPEETYEIWHFQENLNLNLNKFKNNQEVGPEKILEDILNQDESELEIRSDENDEDDGDGEEDEYDSKAKYQLNKLTNSFDSSKNWTKANFLIRTRGLEVLPIENYGRGINNKTNIIKQHINNLKTLLHLNIMRCNWALAYKIFCLLIRLPYVDIRSIWPIGIEILTCRQIELEEESPQIQKFFEWLSSFHVINGTSVNSSTKPSRKISAPVWRSGSKTHTPMYLVTQLWDLVKKKDYINLKDKLEELLLEPPYNTDGVFYYLLVICNFTEVVKLMKDYLNFNSETSNYNSSIDIYDKILEHIQDIEKKLEICKQLSFKYPESIKNDLNFVIKLMNDDFNESSVSDINDSPSDDHNINDINRVSIPIELGYNEPETNQYDEYDDELNFKNNYDKHETDSNRDIENNPEGMDFDFDFD